MAKTETVTCNTLVWLREKQFEAGTTFDVVDAPKTDKQVDPTTATAWGRNGWLKAASGKAGEGA